MGRRAWIVETAGAEVDAEIEALPLSLRARLIRLMEMVEAIGLENIREPHVKHLEGKLWELRAKAGCRHSARNICNKNWQARDHSACLRKEIPENAESRAATCEQADGKTVMTSISELKKRWMDDPQFRKEYEDADAEYEVIQTLIKVRNDAALSQAELAQRIGTTQSAIARLEGGGVSPTISTLRRYAKATGTKLQVSLSRE